jgi:hypothetical protein
MAASGIVADRTDLVGEILKMSRRRRLYIYYLVETRERVNPSPDGFIKSQTDYVPNIKEFKNKMIASKLKFYKRFTGGYIYWHKLTEAIGIAHRADPMISVAEKCLKKDVFINEQSANILDDVEETEETGSAASKKKTMSVEEKRKQAVGLMLQNAMTSMRLIKENAKPDISLTQKAMNQQMISTLAEDSKKLLERLSYYATQMRAEKIQAYTHRDGLETYGRDMFQDGYKITRVAVGVVDDAGAAALDYFADIDIGQVSQYFTIGPNGLGAIGMMVGALFSFYNVIEGHAAMTGLDITANLASGVRGLGFTAKGITNIVGLFKDNSAITAIGGPVAATALAGVEAGVAIVKGVSYKRNSDYRKKAKDLASKKTSQDELTKAMLELNEKLGKRERTGFVTSAITAACSLTAAIVMLTAPVTAGAGLFAGAAILGVGMYAKGKDSDYAREMKLSLFDSYYKMDDKFTAALVEYNRRNPRLPLTDDEKFKLYDQLRRRVAVQQGFYSPSHAAKFVAEQYAKDMLFRAHFGPDQDMYIAMIKGLGLSYKYDLSKNKDIPTVSDIVKKMCK